MTLCGVNPVYLVFSSPQLYAANARKNVFSKLSSDDELVMNFYLLICLSYNVQQDGLLLLMYLLTGSLVCEGLLAGQLVVVLETTKI